MNKKSNKTNKLRKWKQNSSEEEFSLRYFEKNDEFLTKIMMLYMQENYAYIPYLYEAFIKETYNKTYFKYFVIFIHTANINLIRSMYLFTK